MAVDKFSISIPEEIVASIDGYAEHDGLTRSGLIREALAEYIERRSASAAERERHERISRAIEGFERIAASWGSEERSAADLVRELREESLGDG